MIKINLLPTKRRKKPKPVPGFLIAMVLFALFAVIVSAYAVYFMNSKIEALQAEKRENARKIEELNRKIAEVKDFEKRNNVFMERKRIIEELTQNQSMPVKVLDEMSKRLTEGIWLTSMQISRGRVTISGVGFSNSDIFAYVQNLKASELFSEVYNQGTSQVQLSGVPAYRFDINFNVGFQAGSPAGVPPGGRARVKNG